MDDKYTELEAAVKKQAEFVESLKYEDLSEHTVMQAKQIILDSIGCMAIGNSQYDLKGNPKGDYIVVGQGSTTKEAATFFNGSSMVKNELDEGNQFAFGHPACHILPAFLSEIENKKISGKKSIEALVAAYEVSCRWGCSTKIKPEMHVHGTMQTMGAAAVSSKLNGCTKEEIEKSIIFANSLPQATSWSSAFCGDQLRNAYIGIANVIGMNAHRMVRSGIESSIQTLWDVWEKVLNGSIQTENLTVNLGQEFYMDKNYFKIHAACRYTHSFADMLHKFMSDGLTAEDVKKITIDTYAAAAKLKGQEARNSFAMRFSIPVAAGICLVYGDLSVENVIEEHVKDKRVLELASKVVVNENKDFTAQLPAIRHNKMVVETYSGKRYEEDSLVTKGDYLDPFGKNEVVRKFKNLTKEIWSDDRQNNIIDFVMSLEENENMEELFQLICSEKGR